MLEPAAWAPDLLDLAFGLASRPTIWKARFWERLPHPDTSEVEHGPEADVTLEADGDWFYAVEVKWLGDIPPNHGRSRQKTQLEMRAASVARASSRPERRGVILIAPQQSRDPPARTTASTDATFPPTGTAIGETFREKTAAGPTSVAFLSEGDAEACSSATPTPPRPCATTRDGSQPGAAVGRRARPVWFQVGTKSETNRGGRRGRRSGNAEENWLPGLS